MSGLWRYSEPNASEGKYLIQRRDGSIPEWPWFVIGAKDPAASVCLEAYANECERLEYDPQYVEDVRKMADEFKEYCHQYGEGDPYAPPHRKDDPAIIEKMRKGHSA